MSDRPPGITPIEEIMLRHAIIAAAFAAAPLHAAQPDPAAGYPNKPIRFIVPFSPGAGTDTTARTIAQKLGEKWGQQAVVDNRTGAAGAIGVDFTAKANPDGYTICLISASNSVNSATNPSLPYDLEKDLQGISQATSLFYVIYIHPSLPAKTVKELIAHAKAHPGKLNFGTSGTGTLQHFAGELLNHQAGTRIVHVPYKGTAAVIPAMLSGEVQVGFGSLIGTRPQMVANRVRGIAITSKKRAPAIDLPTVAESGLPNYEVDQWYGVITSSRVPKPIVSKLHAAIAEALKAPDVVTRLAGDGSTPVGSTPEQFNAHIRSEIAKWKRLVKDANLKLHQG
jgi:tripartite-type tricarboxylate transporter receptor subunit TctC